MKTLTQLGVIALSAVGLMISSCGNKSQQETGEEAKTIKVKPETTSVSGPLGSFFTVVDREYSTTAEEFLGGVITIELTRNAEPTEMPWSSENISVESYNLISSSRHAQVGFGIELLDKDGNIVGKTAANGSGLTGPYDTDECVALVQLNPGETGSIRFHVDQEAADAVAFRITSAYSITGSDDSSEVSVVETASDDDVTSTYDSSDFSESGTSGSADWDDVLDAYEHFIDKYIPFCQKVANNEIKITDPEYSQMMREAMEYASKMQAADSEEMTAAQYARLTKLIRKANAAAAKIR